MQQYQVYWRINRMTSPHLGKTGSKIVEAANQDIAGDRVMGAVSRQLTGCTTEDVCVYLVNPISR